MRYINNGKHWIDENKKKYVSLAINRIGPDNIVRFAYDLPATAFRFWKEVCLDEYNRIHSDGVDAIVGIDGFTQEWKHGRRVD